MGADKKNLVFINSSNPEDSKSLAKRKAVRSQAAKDHSQDSSNKPEASKARRHKKLTTIEIELNVDNPGSFATGPPQLSTHLLPRPVSGTGWVHPLVPYPNKCFVPGVPSQYLSELAVGIPELGQPNENGSLRSIWFPMVSADRRTLDLIVLTAATNSISVGRAQCDPSILVKFKEHAISSINQALRGTNPVITDRLIGAAAKMAAYEAGFAGDEKQYHVHMKGLIKMVELRGGLNSLGMNGLLARMLLWVDLNAAHVLKTATYFSHS
ncbi:MAG: hypothetical protein LQ350_004977 [Teloschistes chrysophthalmus]|nr:MAG: hypothetical protein LQ350_004977 [Niorma chrysophthalma]